MSLWKVIGRNLLFFRRHNLGIILAAAMCSLVLTGALTVGDSVRSTLLTWQNKELEMVILPCYHPTVFLKKIWQYEYIADWRMNRQ